jgi:predicted nucleic-acid-binding protein
VAAFDTNVIVRVLVGDDPVQSRKAERAFVTHSAGEGVFVSLVVLGDVSWVLAAAYDWDRATIHERLSRLLRWYLHLCWRRRVVPETSSDASTAPAL